MARYAHACPAEWQKLTPEDFTVSVWCSLDATDYHHYTIVQDKGEIRFYLDGNPLPAYIGYHCIEFNELLVSAPKKDRKVKDTQLGNFGGYITDLKVVTGPSGADTTLLDAAKRVPQGQFVNWLYSK